MARYYRSLRGSLDAFARAPAWARALPERDRRPTRWWLGVLLAAALALLLVVVAPRDPYVGPDGLVYFVGQAGNYLASLDAELPFARHAETIPSRSSIRPCPTPAMPSRTRARPRPCRPMPVPVLGEQR